MASLSTCHLGLWLGWQILLNLVKRSVRRGGDVGFLVSQQFKVNLHSNPLVFNPFVLKFHILLSPLISSVFIALQDTRPISLKNSRICWKFGSYAFIILYCFVILIFIWTYIPSAITTTFNGILVSFNLK